MAMLSISFRSIGMLYIKLSFIVKDTTLPYNNPLNYRENVT